MTTIAEAKAAAVKARGWLEEQGIKSRHVRSHRACGGAFVTILVPADKVAFCKDGLKPIIGPVRFWVLNE